MKRLFSVSLPALGVLVALGCRRVDESGGVVAAAPAASPRVAGVGIAAAGVAQAPQASPSTARVTDAPIAPFRRELLQFAFEAASSFPLEPHAKSRARAQERLVVAAFDLDQPLLALGFAPQIADWRRGAAYADFAWYSARHGAKAEVPRYVALAEGVLAQERRDPDDQDWHGDTIRLKIARAWQAAGDAAKAEQAAKDVDALSTGAVDRQWSEAMTERVERLTPASVDDELAAIDAGFEAQDLGAQFTTLLLVARIHGKFYGDARLRGATEARLLERFVRLPPDLRLAALTALVENCVDHSDDENAVRLIGEMVEVLDGAHWRPTERIQQLAHVSELRARAGDGVRARAELESTLRLYHQQRDEIESWERAATLRPLAVVWHLLGDEQQAEGLLSLVVEEGAENPNARPRCNDLVDTCIAMAKHEIRPSARVLERLREVRDGLKDPW